MDVWTLSAVTAGGHRWPSNHALYFCLESEVSTVNTVENCGLFLLTSLCHRYILITGLLIGYSLSSRPVRQ